MKPTLLRWSAAMLAASAVAAQPDASVPAQEVAEARHLAAGVRFGVMWRN